MSQHQEKAPEPEPAVVHMPVDSGPEAAEAAGPQAPVPLSPLAGVKGKRRRDEPAPVKVPTALELATEQAQESSRAAWVKHRTGGRNDHGTFKKDVVERPTRSRAGERLPQLIKHISEVVLSLAGGYEIEAMWVRGTLVLAGNTYEQVDKVMGRVRRAVDNAEIAADDDMLRQLLALASPGAKTRVAKTVAKLRNMEDGVRGRGWDEMRESDPDTAELEALHAVLSTQSVPSLVMDQEDAIAELEAPPEARTHSVIFLYDAKVHAEQQLVRLLSSSSFRGERATIRGTKRPCYGCYLALTYAKQFQGCAGLNHGVRAGGLWMGSVDTALEHITAMPGSLVDPVRAAQWVNAEVSRFDDARQHKSKLKSGAVVGDEDSESDSEADDDL